MRALPIDFRVDINHQFGAYVQDRWTIERLTLNAGLRLRLVPEQLPGADVGPAPLAPTGTSRFATTDGLSLHDLNPKLSAAYDLLGRRQDGASR